jgi:glutamyl-tRNA synthetase
VRTRFAPSPTGDLHIGGAFTAVASFWLAKASSGSAVLRVEDLDTPRVVRGAEESQREDLAWLGLEWDPPVVRQSDRLGLYDAALDVLAAVGRTYLCDCSRTDISRVASAPHAGEELAYPGTCRAKDPQRAMKRPPSVRLRIDESDAQDWTDHVAGMIPGSVLTNGGDFVLRRADGVFAYQLAVAVDDLSTGVTAVVRGDDLIPSTPRQVLVMKLLGAAKGALPEYWHLPLVRAADGSRLAKRTPGGVIRGLRSKGIPPEEIIGHIAQGLGLLSDHRPVSARELARAVPPSTPFSRTAWRVPDGFT